MDKKIIKVFAKIPRSLTDDETKSIFKDSIKSISTDEQIQFLNRKLALHIIILPQEEANIPINVIEYIFSKECSRHFHEYNVVLINILDISYLDYNRAIVGSYKNENIFKILTYSNENSIQ